MRSIRAALAGAVVLPMLAASGCSQRAAGDTQPQPVPSVLAAYVPDVVGAAYDTARLDLTQAKLVPIVRFAPELTSNPGHVAATEPPAGTQAKPGDVIVLVVAGKPEASVEGDPAVAAINQLATADEQSVVGIGRDPDGTIVVAFAPGVDLFAWKARVAAIMRATKFRLQACNHSLADLRGLQRTLAERTFLPRAAKMQFGMYVDPLTCSLMLGGEFTPDEVSQLRQKYGDALTIRPGVAARN
jgi:hypothetical protein